MKLSELVDLKLRMEEYFNNKLTTTLNNLINEFKLWEGVALTHNRLIELQNEIKEIDHLTSLKFENFLKDIEEEIENKSNVMLTLGYELEGKKVLGPSQSVHEDKQFRSINVSDKFKEQLGSKIRTKTDWRYPCLEIGPGEGTWTDNLVGCDPLYLVDIHPEYLEATKLKYTRQFSRRIRSYLIGSRNGQTREKINEYNLSALPKNQIGFIFSWAVFDFLFINEIEIYLKSCFEVLKPGGKMIFSFNDCDKVIGAQFAEKGERSWVTKKALNKLFSEIGFGLTEFYCDEIEKHSWVEIEKPGSMVSMKIGQPKVSIHKRQGFENLDTGPTKVYNKQQVARLKQLAIQLGVDTAENIMSGMYEPHVLEKK